MSNVKDVEVTECWQS